MVELRVRNIEIENRIGEAPGFRIYLGATSEKQPVILKVAKTFEDGDLLAKEAGRFNVMRSFGEQVAELEAAQGKSNSHYDWLFASLLSSFMEPTQGDRRINVFAMPDITPSKLVPLTKLYAKVKIDARTSVWILGRFLKFYGFFELLAADEGTPAARYPLFSPDDYFIGPERHRLIYYNFSGDVTDAVATDFVKAVARFVLDWVVIQDDPSEQAYLELLRDFSEAGRDSFGEAHGDLYGLVERLWGIRYHPFTYCDSGTTNWKVIKED